MGVARIFQRGGHTDSYIGYSPNCHLNIVGCLLTKRLTKGGSRAPQDPPWLRPCVVHSKSVYNEFFYVIHFSPILYNAIPFLSNRENTQKKVVRGKNI